MRLRVGEGYYLTKPYVVGTQKNHLSGFECQIRILEHENCPLSRALSEQMKKLFQHRIV